MNWLDHAINIVALTSFFAIGLWCGRTRLHRHNWGQWHMFVQRFRSFNPATNVNSPSNIYETWQRRECLGCSKTQVEKVCDGLVETGEPI